MGDDTHSIRIPHELWERVARLANANVRSCSAEVRTALERHVTAEEQILRAVRSRRR